MGLALVLTAMPDRKSSAVLAGRLVGQRLAACVSIVPGLLSVYRWKGRVERSSECLLVVKTLGSRYQEVERAIRKLHPYEVPEIIRVTPSAAAASYRAWIHGSARRVPSARKRSSGL